MTGGVTCTFWCRWRRWGCTSFSRTSPTRSCFWFCTAPWPGTSRASWCASCWCWRPPPACSPPWGWGSCWSSSHGTCGKPVGNVRSVLATRSRGPAGLNNHAAAFSKSPARRVKQHHRIVSPCPRAARAAGWPACHLPSLPRGPSRAGSVRVARKKSKSRPFICFAHCHASTALVLTSHFDFTCSTVGRITCAGGPGTRGTPRVPARSPA